MSLAVDNWHYLYHYFLNPWTSCIYFSIRHILCLILIYLFWFLKKNKGKILPMG
jgi:hypothetical protein